MYIENTKLRKTCKSKLELHVKSDLNSLSTACLIFTARYYRIASFYKALTDSVNIFLCIPNIKYQNRKKRLLSEVLSI